MKEKEAFIIDTSKISKSEKEKNFIKATIESILKELGAEEKKPLEVGSLAATLEGPFAHVGLMVIEKKPDGTVRLSPGPEKLSIEVHETKLWHITDYREAFNVALVEAQDLNPDRPQ